MPYDLASRMNAAADQMNELAREQNVAALNDYAAALREYALEVAKLESAYGDVPTNAQGLALARFMRPHFRSASPIDRIAIVSTGGVQGLPGDYLHVRFSDGYEGGIDREGRTST